MSKQDTISFKQLKNTEKRRHTKQKILDTLDDLLVHRDIDSIKVTDICTKAGISRDTFYKCFADKYDVCGWKLGEDMSRTIYRILSVDSGDTDTYNNWYDFYLLLTNSRRLYINAWSTTCYNSLDHYAYEYSLICARKVSEQLPAEKQTHLHKQFLEYSISASTAITSKWIKDGMKTSPENMAAIHICFLPKLSFDFQNGQTLFHDICYYCDSAGSALLTAYEKKAENNM